MNRCNPDADFARFCLIVEFWLMTECPPDTHTQLAVRIETVRQSPCAINGGCSESYVSAILNLLRQLPGWHTQLEQKALAGSGFAHLTIADGYR